VTSKGEESQVPAKCTGYSFFELYPDLKEGQSDIAPETAKAKVYPLPDRSGYPHFEIYLASKKDSATFADKVSEPCDRPGHLYLEPYQAANQSQGDVVSEIPEKYASQSLDRSGYSHFNLYPTVKKERNPRAMEASEKVPQLIDRTGYPWFELYPAAKDNDTSAMAEDKVSQLVGEYRRYTPHTVSHLDRTGHHYCDLYSAVNKTQTATTPATREPIRSDRSGYQYFELHPAVKQVYRSGNPFFELYPPVSVASTSSQSQNELVADLLASNHAVSSVLWIIDTTCTVFNSLPQWYLSLDGLVYPSAHIYPPPPRFEDTRCKVVEIVTTGNSERADELAHEPAQSKAGPGEKVRNVIAPKRGKVIKYCGTL